VSGAWYDIAFDAFYADLYAHRNEAEAERAVSWLAGELLAAGAGALAGKTVLDLACGAGRHVRALARRRARVVGIDRSWPLLEKARAARGEAIERQQLVAGDLRALPFADRSFDIALSMFTSLGYFEEDGRRKTAHRWRARPDHQRGCRHSTSGG
jgi:SAM-dependent methyltransferase